MMVNMAHHLRKIHLTFWVVLRRLNKKSELMLIWELIAPVHRYS